jgi:hypothetical protein
VSSRFGRKAMRRQLATESLSFLMLFDHCQLSEGRCNLKSIEVAGSGTGLPQYIMHFQSPERHLWLLQQNC